MNATWHRETFIALRARRTGYRIAAEILNPPLNRARRVLRDPDDEYLNAVRTQRWIRRAQLRHLRDTRRLQIAVMVLAMAFIAGISALILGFQWLYGPLR